MFFILVQSEIDDRVRTELSKVRISIAAHQAHNSFLEGELSRLEKDHKAVLEAKQGTIESLQRTLSEARHEHAMFRRKVLLQKVRISFSFFFFLSFSFFPTNRELMKSFYTNLKTPSANSLVLLHLESSWTSLWLAKQWRSMLQHSTMKPRTWISELGMTGSLGEFKIHFHHDNNLRDGDQTCKGGEVKCWRHNSPVYFPLGCFFSAAFVTCATTAARLCLKPDRFVEGRERKHASTFGCFSHRFCICCICERHSPPGLHWSW